MTVSITSRPAAVELAARSTTVEVVNRPTAVAITQRPTSIAVRNAPTRLQITSRPNRVAITNPVTRVTINPAPAAPGTTAYLVAGDNVRIDRTDPARPVIHADDDELAEFNDNLALLYSVAKA